MTTWEQCPVCGEWENPRDNPEAWRLAKAAPGLLDACEAAYAWMLYLVDDMVAPDERIALEKLSAAIAKAR